MEITLKEPIIKEKRSYVSTQFQIGDWEKHFIDEFGKRYINYREEWEQAGPNSIPDFPLHIDFQLIDDCNMRCTFCPRNSKVLKAMDYEDGLNNGTVMSLDVFKKIIDEGEKFGLPAINLGASAEPLMHPDVVEMVRYAREHGVMDIRQQILDETIKMLNEVFDLTYNVSTASDPFFGKTAESKKQAQLLSQSKYEINAKLPFNDSSVSIASFNDHGNVFYDRFNIAVKDENSRFSGCVGWGYERIIYSILAQKGADFSSDYYKRFNLTI